MAFGICKTCSIASIFIIANIFVMFSSININKDYFYSTLNDELINRYEKIVKERRNIYYVGFILGIVLSIGIISIMKLKKIKLSKLSIICLAGAITFITNYLYYILYPKSDYMLIYLDNKNQREEWLKLNKDMKKKVHIGFILGIISVMIFTNIYKY